MTQLRSKLPGKVYAPQELSVCKEQFLSYLAWRAAKGASS